MKRLCSNCGKISESEIEIKFCVHCGAEFAPQAQDYNDIRPDESLEPLQTIVSTQDADEQEKYCPWENRAKLGFFKALFQTWKECIFSPAQFFNKLPRSGGMGGALFYGIIFCTFGSIMGTIWKQVHLFGYTDFLQYLGLISEQGPYGEYSGHSILFLLLSPIFIIVGLYLNSAIYHLTLIFLGWAKENFEGTFKIISYSESISIFSVVPVLSIIVLPIWTIVLCSIGLKRVHRLATWQAVLVALVPYLLIFCCIGCLILFYLTIIK